MTKLAAPALAAVLLVAAPNGASAISVKDLLGTWEGHLIVTGVDRESKESMTMEFRPDGAVVITHQGTKTERVPFEVEGEDILFKKAGTKEPEARLKGARIQNDELRGVLVPDQPGEKHRWKMEVVLRKKP